jgi:hypothetical protein
MTEPVQIDLAGWTGSAIIVEAKTGVTYRFRPNPDSDSEHLIEGFWVPVTGMPGIHPKGRITEAFYDLFCSDDVPLLDNSRKEFLEGHLAINTKYGKGWLIWSPAEEEDEF